MIIDKIIIILLYNSIMISISKIIIFLIIRILSNPFANLFQKKLANRNSSITINFYAFLILSILAIPLYRFVEIQNYNLYFYFMVLFAGLLCTLGTLCLIKSIEIGELSVIGPINAYKSIIGLITAFFLLDEFPTLFGIFGIFLIICGTKFIFFKDVEGFSFDLLKRKDIQFRILALILTGIEAAFLKQIIVLSSIEASFVLWCINGTLFSLVLLLINKKKIVLSEKIDYTMCFIIAICLGLMQYSTNYIFKFMNVGYALALFQLSSIVNVIIGYKIFNEKHFRYKLLGCVIMIIGSCLIILKS